MGRPYASKVFDATDIRLALPEGRQIFSDFFPIKNGNGLPFAHAVTGAAEPESEGLMVPIYRAVEPCPPGPL
jgi:hypothetical protein